METRDKAAKAHVEWAHAEAASGNVPPVNDAMIALLLGRLVCTADLLLTQVSHLVELYERSQPGPLTRDRYESGNY